MTVMPVMGQMGDMYHWLNLPVESKKSDCDIPVMISVGYGQVYYSQTSENTRNIVY